jgi:hypothetical protein
MKRAYIAVLAVAMPLLFAPVVFAADFTIPPALPVGYSYNGYDYIGYIMGCSAGYTSAPCGSWLVSFYTATSTYSDDYGATFKAMGTTGDLLVPQLSNDAHEFQMGNGWYTYYPCTGAFNSCSFYGVAGGGIGMWGDQSDSMSYFHSDRNFYSTTSQSYYAPSANTEIVSLVPTVATTTVVAITYTVSADDLASTTAAGGTVRFLSRVNGLDTGFTSTSTAYVVSSSGFASTSYAVLLPHSGIYQVYASLFVENADSTFGQVFDSTTTEFTFNGTFYSSVYGTTTPAGLAIPNAECDVTHLAGCVQNAIVFLFYPNQTALDMFAQFKDTLYQKPPVGYFAMIQSSLAGVSASSTGAIVGWSIPAGIMTTFFTPIETAVAGVLGFFVLVEFYKRFKDVEL